ncbi:hypothetical protein EDF67_101966 [Sphingobacterium sp. JUb78]|nr:hypothetical protein [Sphingobacterium kitahiroshimense]TCR14859.1 hypothetical protein EDF67_101966 [Sphingobacterium sp. JUb78]
MGLQHINPLGYFHDFPTEVIYHAIFRSYNDKYL